MKTFDPAVLGECIPQIVEAGVEAMPREIGGFICPDGTIFWLTNEAEEEQQWLVSADQLHHAFNGGNGLRELGFDYTDILVWHTHPSGFIGPSRQDLESRRDPEVADFWKDTAYATISLPGGEVVLY
ncbi:MAG: hypothetical protein ACRD1R_09690 [Acidobacteriota bacterium]